jgi:hypothetical protein
MENYKEQLEQNLLYYQEQLEKATCDFDWAKAYLEHETFSAKRSKLSLIWLKLRIYGNKVGYNEIHAKQTEWCNKLWDYYTEQIEIAFKKMTEAIDKKNMVKSKN